MDELCDWLTTNPIVKSVIVGTINKAEAEMEISGQTCKVSVYRVPRGAPHKPTIRLDITPQD